MAAQEPLPPREPEAEKGKAAHEQYLAIAHVYVKESTLDYSELYRRYCDDAMEAQALEPGRHIFTEF